MPGILAPPATATSVRRSTLVSSAVPTCPNCGMFISELLVSASLSLVLKDGRGRDGRAPDLSHRFDRIPGIRMPDRSFPPIDVLSKIDDGPLRWEKSRGIPRRGPPLSARRGVGDAGDSVARAAR